MTAIKFEIKSVQDAGIGKIFGMRGLHTVTVYTVVAEWHNGEGGVRAYGGTVTRRYTDFDWLRYILSLRYPGMMIPAVPPKKINNRDKLFIQERRAGLQRFLNLIGANPFLQTDVSVQQFMNVGGCSQPSSCAAWEKQRQSAIDAQRVTRNWKSALYGVLSTDSKSCDGLRDWCSFLDTLSLTIGGEKGSDIDEVVSTVMSLKLEVSALKEAVKMQNNQALIMRDSNDALATSLADFQTSMDDQAQVKSNIAKNSVSGYGGSTLAADRCKKGAEVSALASTALGSWQQMVQFRTAELQLFICDTIDTELAMLTSLESLFLLFEQSASTLQMLRAKKNKAEESLSQLNVNQDEATKHEKERDLQVVITSCSRKISLVTTSLMYEAKGITLLELPRYVQWKKESTSQNFAQLSALQVAASERSRTLWMSVLDGLDDGNVSVESNGNCGTNNANLNSVYLDAKKSMESNSLPVLDHNAGSVPIAQRKVTVNNATNGDIDASSTSGLVGVQRTESVTELK